MKKIEKVFEKNTDKMVVFINQIDICPNCERGIDAEWLHQFYDKLAPETAYAFMKCPSCKTCCSVEYLPENEGAMVYAYNRIVGTNIIEPTFLPNIAALSSVFVSIYMESYHAEKIGHLGISGMGYRKALEFLIKDYLISIFPDKADLIKKQLLGKCIEEHVTNHSIKKVAKRAVWLGNDETHYVKTWINKDISDLKKLIEVTMYWIEMEIITSTIDIEMPDLKKST